MSNTKTSLNLENFEKQIRGFAPLMLAFIECSDDLQFHAVNMFKALANPELDEDEKHLAAMTLADILYQNYVVKVKISKN